MTTKARDVMTPNPDHIDTSATVLDAAKKLAEGDYGALPICGEDGRLKGVLTDRDIVVDVIAKGKDPSSTKVSELATGDSSTITIGADDPIEEALRTMAEHQVRRLPVVDGTELVGMVSQADVARTGEDQKVGDTVESISR
jgi:CBS domain-containing protein